MLFGSMAFLVEIVDSDINVEGTDDGVQITTINFK